MHEESFIERYHVQRALLDVPPSQAHPDGWAVDEALVPASILISQLERVESQSCSQWSGSRILVVVYRHEFLQYIHDLANLLQQPSMGSRTTIVILPSLRFYSGCRNLCTLPLRLVEQPN